MKEKILKLPKAVVVLIGILITAGFLASMNISSVFWAAVLPNTGYLLQMAGELVGTVYIMLVVILLGYQRILKEKGVGFGKGFYIGGFMVGYCGYVLVAQFYLQSMSENVVLQPFALILVFALTMFLIGLNEEVVMRGAVLNLLLDRFTNTRKGVLGAIITSSTIFGAAHLFNVFSGVSLKSAVIQALQATLLGILFAAIYLRSGNIWITIIAHALTDFASLMPNGIFGSGSMISGINSLSLLNLVVTVPLFLIPCLVLLRKSKLDEIVQQRSGMAVVPDEKEADNTAVVSLICGIIGIVTGCMGYSIGVAIVGLLGACVSRGIKRHDNAVATAAMVTSIVGLVLSAIMTIVMIFVLPMMEGFM